MKMKIYEITMEIHTESGWILNTPSLLASTDLNKAQAKAEMMELEYNLGVRDIEPADNEEATERSRTSARDAAADAKGLSYTLLGVQELEVVEGADGKLHRIECYHFAD